MLIKNILICEDIRQEVGNKLSLMGVLGSSINIDTPPNMPKEFSLALSLACLISIENTNTGNDAKDFNIQISIFIGENKIGNITAKIQSTGIIDRMSHFPVPKFEFAINKTITLSVHAQIMKKNTLVSENTAILDIILNKIS
ncbi:MAG: hypothetical protein Q7U88_09305 [Desulfocapsaceae bacterium]|nr:hypothetical protein [Desulfocapsaceae bacterium]